MSKSKRKPGRLARAREIFRKRPKPFRALNEWARQGDRPGLKYRRFRTLVKFASFHVRRARGAGRKAWEFRRKRYRQKRRFYAKRIAQLEKPPTPESGVSIFDGKPVPNWIVEIAQRARETGLWWGVVISGVRTSEQSVALCIGICGAPKCDGKCAGVDSNHNADEPVVDGEGAIDVTDHVGFIRALAEIGESDRLKNTIGPSDPNHFSRSGQ